jgi:hypothetical protein
MLSQAAMRPAVMVLNYHLSILVSGFDAPVTRGASGYPYLASPASALNLNGRASDER